MITRYYLIVLWCCVMAGAAAAADTAPGGAPTATTSTAPYVPRKLGRSLLDQAGAAAERNDLAKACTLYEKWLEAEPHDTAAWYNLACAYARRHDIDHACDALEYAVDAGFTDLEQARKDDDLAGLRNDPRFKVSLEHMAQRGKMDGPPGYIRRFAVLQTVGTYIVMLPPDYQTSGKTYPLCVILHGYGSSELWHGKIAEHAGREGVIYIAVRAPHPLLDSGSPPGEHGWTAWPPDPIPDSDPMVRQVEGQYVEWIFQCVADAQRNYRVAPGKTFLFGQSQGGHYALACALLHPERVAGVLDEAGPLPRPEVFSPENVAKLKAAGVRIEILHGKEDTMVSPEESRKIAEIFAKGGVNVTLNLVAGTHAVDEGMRQRIRAWVDRELRGK